MKSLIKIINIKKNVFLEKIKIIIGDKIRIFEEFY